MYIICMNATKTQTRLRKRNFPKKHCIKHLLCKLSKYTSKQYTVYWLRDITVHQALFRTVKVHALIPAKDQTLFNTIPSNEGSYEFVPVLNLARM